MGLSDCLRVLAQAQSCGTLGCLLPHRQTIVCRERARVLDYHCLKFDEGNETRGRSDHHGYQEGICSKGVHHGNRLRRDGRIRLAV
jgi:hypothetical protein